MGTWNETGTLEGPRLLPEGVRTYEIQSATPVVNKYTNNRELVLRLVSSAGSGEHTVPLEPFKNTSEALELWEKILKTWASKLGFEPSSDSLEMVQIANEFASTASNLVGSIIELDVQHVDGKEREDGTFFKNQRVYINKLVAKGSNGVVPTPMATAAVSGFDDDSIPF
jgi:hypothetical protein